MTDVEFISEEHFRDLVGRSLSKQEIQEIYSDKITLADSLLLMCDAYEKMFNRDSDYSKKNALALGANIIFNLRKFLLEEDITLSIGATTAENENLSIYEGNITDILRNKKSYSVSISEGISVIKKLENLQLQEHDDDAMRNSIWQRILDAQSLTGPYKDFQAIKSNCIGERQTSDGIGFVRLYQRNLRLPDDAVYYGYRNNRIYTYYATDNFQLLNNGWLFEHFMKKWTIADDKQKAALDLRSRGEHPVSIAVDKWDTIAGYKGGDYRDIAGRQIQIKYQKQNFIRSTIITKVIRDIKKILVNRKNDYLNMGHDLAQLFTHEKNMDFRGAADKVNKAYNRKLWKEVGIKDIPKKLQVNINLTS